jgi:hypothetical protein
MAWILSLSCTLLEIKTSFKTLFALMAQCSLLLFLQDTIVYAIIRLRGTQAQTVAELTPRLGLDLFLSGVSKPVMALIGYFSVFNIWYIVTVTFVLSFLGACSKKKAFFAAIPVWLFPLCLVVGLAWLN